MLISDKKRFIFVHIYKTAGSSITRLLGPYIDEHYRAKVPRVEGAGWQGTWHYSGRQHAKLEQLRVDPAWKGRDLTQYRICTVVRNPYTWALSVWNDFYRSESEFPEFCRLIKGASRGLNPSMWGSYSQLSFIADPELKPAFIARFEHLKEDVRSMLELLDIPFTEMPHEIWNNPNERSDALAFYNDEAQSTINDMFAADFQAFGYEMIQP
jgi:sulfotransferase famil protein